jgi:hypothetical protein
MLEQSNCTNTITANRRRGASSAPVLLVAIATALLTPITARADTGSGIARHAFLVGSLQVLGEAEIIAKVLSVKLIGLPVNSLAMSYKVRVIFSDSSRIQAGKAVAIRGERVSPLSFSLYSGSDPVAHYDPIMRPGATFVATVRSTKVRGRFKFGSATILPIGLPIPSPVLPAEIKPLEVGLRAWGEARRSNFHFYPYANVLAQSQAARLMESRNYYLWALGVSSYCGGASQMAIVAMVSRTFNRSKPLSIRLPNGQTYKSVVQEHPQLSVRRAAWMLYAMAVYPIPWCRLTARSVVCLMATTAYRWHTAPRWKFLANVDPWESVNPGLCNFRMVSPRPMRGRIRYSASVAGFLKNRSRSQRGNKVPPVPDKLGK